MRDVQGKAVVRLCGRTARREGQWDRSEERRTKNEESQVGCLAPTPRMPDIANHSKGASLCVGPTGSLRSPR